MNRFFRKGTALAASLAIAATSAAAAPAANRLTADAASTEMVLEYLDRGISAINTGSGMLVSWRYLANDDDNAVYKLYRDGSLIYTSEAGKSTCYLDTSGSASSKYRVDTLSGGSVVGSEDCRMISNNAYFDIPLTPPTSSDATYSPNDMSVGDVDGDGQYELFLKWDPSNSKDNSQKGKTDKVYIDCLRLDGTRLWRIDLGWNIRAGAHYTQFYVADFDLDGKCEMTCKTADGTVDGTGKRIGTDTVYRNSDGLIITGPEYYTLFDGETGAALDTVNFEVGRGTTTAWGKSSDKFNRVDRFWGTVAYLDGVHPCVVSGRGYYGRMTATAWAVENKKLKKLWIFDTGTSTSAAGYGCGNHNSMPVDVDGDGRQEIVTGASVIDDNGTLYYTTGQGHGDAMHVGDLDPTNPGFEAWICHEESSSGYGVSLLDLDQKKILYHQNGAGDTGRCCADNVWAGNPGAECWGNKLSDNSTPVVDTKGNVLSCRRPAINFLSYWDGDLEREILDGYTDSPATIAKMNENGTLTTILTTDGYYTCNTTKGTPCLSADIFGDWREELIVRAANHKSVRIYCTPYDTDYRITTLMHDPHYRMQVSSQQTAYNQPPHTSFFMGTGYDLPARPAGCTVNGSSASFGKPGAAIDTAHKYTIKNKNSGLFLNTADEAVANGTNVQQDTQEQTWTFENAGGGYYRIYSEAGDGKTYLLDLDYGKTDNGTNIGVWGDTASDAQLFKLVDNGDGSYTICTKATSDESCLGVTAGSKESGANVVQWSCNGSDDQKWILDIKILPVSGYLFKDLTVKDTSVVKGTYNYLYWQIVPSQTTGSPIFGDRETTFTALPAELNGAEAIQTACDSKNVAGDLAQFTAGADMNAYVLLDSRVKDAGLPAWLGSWEETSLSAAGDNDLTFIIYKKALSEGDTVILGENCTSTGTVVNYAVFGKAAPASGRIVQQLEILDNPHASAWSLESSVESGSTVFGDREFTYTEFPAVLEGAEYIKTSCDSKSSTGTLAKFSAAENAKVYIAIDARVENEQDSLPAWLGEYTKTGDTLVSSNDVTFDLYEKTVSAGDTVMLGDNGTATSVVGYTVFVKSAESIPGTTDDPSTDPDTPAVVPEGTVFEDGGIVGDANEDNTVTLNDAVAILQFIALSEKYPLTAQGKLNADTYDRGEGSVSGIDALSIQKYDAGLTSLPETRK